MGNTSIYKWIEALQGVSYWKGPIPIEVRDCGARIDSCGAWWQASVNRGNSSEIHNKNSERNGEKWAPKKVHSCREAAQFRNRLGAGSNGGVPLWVELKTRIGQAVDIKTGAKILFAAHSRANTEFDNAAIIKSLGLDPANAEIRTELNTDSSIDEKSTLSNNKYFGKFNPFNVDWILSEALGNDVKIEDVCQIFDSSVILNGGFPNTMMTNLGHRKFAFEMHPKDMISSIKKFSQNITVTNIARPCPIWLGLGGGHEKNKENLEWLRFPPPTGPKIGILTGNAPESGITLWQDILEIFRGIFPNLADVLMPEVHVHSLPPMGLSMELIRREDHVWDEMREAIIALLEVGCKVITIACNTTIYYEDRITELCDKRGAKFISIAKACVATLNETFAQKGSETKSVGLLGIGPVVDMQGPYSGYKPHLEAAKIKIKRCAADDLAYDFKLKGAEDPTLVTDFRKLVRRELAQEEVIVLALTEASIIYRMHIERSGKHKDKKQYIDSLKKLAEYLVRIYLEEGYRNCDVCQIPRDYPICDKLLYFKGKVSNPEST